MENENNSFTQGLRDGVPICLGYLSVAFAFGIFTVGNGLSAWEAVLISMTNVTSAGQLAAVPIIASGGSLFELALTQFVINMRYSLMSVSLSQKLGSSVRLIDRFLIAFVNTDEVFAVAISKGSPLGRKYLYGLTLTPYLGWSLGALLGAVAGSILPDMLVSALGIAIYGMFIAIIVPPARKSKVILGVVIVSMLLSFAFSALPVLSSMASGTRTILLTVVIAAAAGNAPAADFDFRIPPEPPGRPHQAAHPPRDSRPRDRRHKMREHAELFADRIFPHSRFLSLQQIEARPLPAPGKLVFERVRC